MRTLLRSAALLLVAACARGPAVPPPVTPEPPTQASVTFLHINDVYEIMPIEGGRVGGLARVAALKKRLEAERGPVLFTHGGDFFSPSALGSALVDGRPLAGRQMVAVLNAARLDWATLGNHEFDVNEATFRQRVAESQFRYVTGNVTDTLGQPFPGILPRAIVTVPTREGRMIRLGLVGTLTPVNRVPYVRYGDQYATVRTQVAAIKDSVDAVVALTHQYFYEDDKLATDIPGIDLVLGGHEHKNYLLRRGRQLAPIVKADGNARTAQVVTLHVGAAGTRPRVTTELVSIDDRLPSDPAVTREVERWLDQAFAGYERMGFRPREVITELREPLDALETTIRFRGSNLTELVLAAMKREAPHADVGIFNAGSVRIDDVLPAGPITQYDIIRILPFGGPLVTVEVTGAIIAQTLLTARANTGIGGFLHAFGARVDGDRILVGGAPIDPARRYTVVTTDFLLTGRETRLGFFSETNPGITGRRDLRDVRMPLIEELRARAAAPP
jgi:5'-nucleotidase